MYPEKVNTQLIEVIEEAREIGELYFEVVEGFRNRERQEKFFAKGAAGSHSSMHQYGLAVSLLAYVDGVPQTCTRVYEELATTMKYAAQNVGVGLKWGAAPHCPNICAYENEFDLLVAEYLTQLTVSPVLNPGYFELVLD
jgi:hypothetical protein